MGTTNPSSKNMKLEDQVTSLEISKKLKELGVKQESEFYWVVTLTTEYHLSWYPNGELPKALQQRNDCYSAFTVAELGVLLPAYIPRAMERRGTDGCTRFGDMYTKFHKAPTDLFHTWFDPLKSSHNHSQEGKLSELIAIDFKNLEKLQFTGYKKEADSRANALIYLLENKIIEHKTKYG